MKRVAAVLIVTFALVSSATAACAAAVEASRLTPTTNVQSDLEILRAQAKCK